MGNDLLGRRGIRGLASVLGCLATLLFLASGCQVVSIIRPSPALGNHTIPDVTVHSEFSKQVILNPRQPALQGSRGLGIARPQDMTISPLQRLQNEELELAEGESLGLYLILLNALDKPRTFLVTILLDYKQVSFELDDRIGLLHEISVPSGTEINLPLRLNIMGSGAHDIMFIAFTDPYNHPLDSNIRENELGNLTGRRAVVIIGRNEPFRVLRTTLFGKDAPANLPLVPIRIGFASAPNGQNTHPSQRYINLSKTGPGQMFSYQVWATNFGGAQKEIYNYAMVGFLDFHQIDLAQPDVTLAQVRPGQEAILNASVQIPSEIGIHELQIVYVFDPYKSILRQEVLAPFVFSTIRLGLDTR